TDPASTTDAVPTTVCTGSSTGAAGVTSAGVGVVAAGCGSGEWLVGADAATGCGVASTVLTTGAPRRGPAAAAEPERFRGGTPAWCGAGVPTSLRGRAVGRPVVVARSTCTLAGPRGAGRSSSRPA